MVSWRGCLLLSVLLLTMFCLCLEVLRSICLYSGREFVVRLLGFCILCSLSWYYVILWGVLDVHPLTALFPKALLLSLLACWIWLSWKFWHLLRRLHPFLLLCNRLIYARICILRNTIWPFGNCHDASWGQNTSCLWSSFWSYIWRMRANEVCRPDAILGILYTFQLVLWS